MDRWVLGPKTQRVWGLNHAIWFTLMGIGGGVFLVGRAFDVTTELGRVLGLPLVDVVSFVLIAIGGVVLIADLGRPLQAWRAFRNVKASWISWGAWADLVFLTFGGLLMLPDLEIGDSTPFSGLGWESEADGAGSVMLVLASIAAVVVMLYAGAVLARPRSIPYWHSVAVPFQFLASSLAMATATVLVLVVLDGDDVTSGQAVTLAVLSAALAVSMLLHLTTDKEAPGKKESIDRLVRGSSRTTFLFVSLLAGTALPALLALVAAAAGGARNALVVVALPLLVVGGFLLRLDTLKAGIYPPVTMPSVPARRTRG
ncbi:MAG: polysulfide reductase NrfD [Acidimicrobiia bacterium]|nr:polysulfide reductase NrfD [Acidimicrobiia bacterium]